MIISILISIGIGVPLGVFSAIRQYSVFDYGVTFLAFFGSSMPTFFFGLLMILFFSVTFKNAGMFYLPPGNALAIKDYVVPLLGRINAGSTADAILHLIMPVSVLVMAYVAGWSRFVRASMLEVLRQDYVRTARAKGLVRARGHRQARPAQRAHSVYYHRGLFHPGRCSAAPSSPKRFSTGPAWAACISTRWAAPITRWPWPCC